MSLAVGFSFVANELGVKFTNQSSSDLGPINSIWNFGDTSSSTEKDPTHTYSNAGVFTVVLQVTDGVETLSLSLDVTVVVSLKTDQTFDQLLIVDMPPAIKTFLDTNNPDFIATKKQELCIRLHKALKVDPAFVYDLTKWPGLSKNLISKLVVYDAMMYIMNLAAAGVFMSSSEDITEGTTESDSVGVFKSITTGPAKVEFYDMADKLSQFISSGTSGGSGLSPLAMLSQGICSIAVHFRLKLQMCPPLPKTYTRSVKVGDGKDFTYSPEIP